MDVNILADLIINDLVILAKMSAHSNVLNPIGCCLETPSPIVVYEFPANVSGDSQTQYQSLRGRAG